MRDDDNLYMGAPVALTTLANGAVTNAAAQTRLRQTSFLEPITDRVAPGVTCFGGDGFLNLTLIEGDDGLIVYDTGEVLEDGERFLKQIRAISDKPIVAVICSHSHYVAGTTALVGDGAGVKIIGHPKLNENLATGMAGSSFPETAPLQVARTLQQFNHFTPAQGPNAASGARVMALGGATMDGPRYIWWNFVASSREKLDAAREAWRAGDWAHGRFRLPAGDDHEFIPAPER